MPPAEDDVRVPETAGLPSASSTSPVTASSASFDGRLRVARVLSLVGDVEVVERVAEVPERGVQVAE